MAEEKHLALELKAPVADMRIVADPDQLKRILYNLIQNAIKFSPEQGTVTIEYFEQGAYAVFGVRDQGIGISAEKQRHLFLPFHQLDTGATRRYGGAGLGLAISKRLVELHEGKIWVESTEGKGCRFTVSIPSRKG